MAETNVVAKDSSEAAKLPPRPSTVMEYVADQLTPDDNAVLERFWKEWLYMHNARNRHTDEVKAWESQFDAGMAQAGKSTLLTDVKGEVRTQLQSSPSMVYLQTDRNMLEQHLGEEGFKIPFEVRPVGKETDAKALDVCRHTLDHFIQLEEVIDELIDFKWDRGRTGTGILKNDVWATRTVNNVPKDGAATGFEFEQSISVTYHVGVKNVNFWDFWWDERATKWKDCRRCVHREVMDIQEFRATFSGRPGFKYVDSVRPVKQDFMAPDLYNYGDNSLVGEERNVYLFHYYNETTGEYWVIANRAWPVYVGWNIMKDSKLPFDVCQMYKRRECIAGMGVGGKTQSFLAYMNNIFGMAMDKVILTSNPPLILGGGGTLDGEIYSGGSDLNVMNFSGDAKQVSQLQLDSSVALHQTMIDMATGQIVQNTGMNPLEYNKPLSGINPFVAGIQEQARKAKIALTQAMYDVSVGRVLNRMLWTLMRFGPQLYAQVEGKVMDAAVDGGKQLKKVKWYNVQVKGQKVTQSQGSLSFEKAPDEYGYYEFKPDLFKTKDGQYYDMAVRVVTPTTDTMLSALKKDNATGFVKNMQLLQTMFPNEKLPATAEEIYEILSEAYQYDPEGIFSKTSERLQREENAKLNKAVLAMNPDKIAAQSGQLPMPGGAPVQPGDQVPAGPANLTAPQQ